MPDAVELVDAIGKAGGSFPGHRAAHAKGVVLAGTFTPTERAHELTRATQFAGDPVRVTVRFSNGGAKPDGSDTDIGDGRGMAMVTGSAGAGCRRRGSSGFRRMSARRSTRTSCKPRSSSGRRCASR